MDDLEYLKWCPFPNCVNAVSCKVTASNLDKIVPSVECLDGHKFCFGCSGQDHQPATCAIAKLWLKKCADDSETSNWISANTKECSKCRSTIEKNGGCNHMTCKKCKFEVIYYSSSFVGYVKDLGRNTVHHGIIVIDTKKRMGLMQEICKQNHELH